MINRMMKTTSSLSYVLFIFCAIIIFSSGCASKKKAAEKEAAEAKARKIAKAKADLEMIINDEGDLTLEEKNGMLNAVKEMGIEDDEVDVLIAKAEAKIREQERMAEKLKEKRKDERPPMEETDEGSADLGQLFASIASATSYTEANKYIGQAMRMFKSDQVPVLIIIGEYDGELDYDKPTTIKNYLNYLKDKKRLVEKIVNVKHDSSGKIVELELKKLF